MSFFKLSMLAGVAAVSIAAAAPAGAVAITQQIYVGGTDGSPTVTTDLTRTPFNTTISQFDLAGIQAQNAGSTVTFNDVKLTFTANARTSGTVRNNAAQDQDFTFSLSLSEFLTTVEPTANRTAAQQIVVSSFGNGTAGAVSAPFGTVAYDLASGQSAAYPPAGPSTLSNSTNRTLTDMTSLNAFTGTGTFGLAMSTGSAQTITGGGGNITASLNTTAGGLFTVVYDYTVTAPPPATVPEPASIALLGAGLLGLGMIRRKSV